MIIRPVTLADEQLLYNWKLDPTTRQNYINPEPPTPEYHHSWLADTIQFSAGFYIAEVDGVPVGQCRINLAPSGRGCELSYSIAPGHRAQGHATKMVSWVVLECLARNLRPIECRIKRHNMCSVKVALRAGVHTIHII